jgi:3-dehydroquinate dehydratase II
MQQKTVLLLNGPNLNLLGTREPEIYGFTTLSEIEEQLISYFNEHHCHCLAFQANGEGAMIDWLHQHRKADFLILNAGGYTHTSIALRDAVAGVNIPFVEVHISNIFKRESFRHHSYFSDLAMGCIVGLGPYGYQLAARFAVDHLKRHS